MLVQGGFWTERPSAFSRGAWGPRHHESREPNAAHHLPVFLRRLRLLFPEKLGGRDVRYKNHRNRKFSF